MTALRAILVASLVLFWSAAPSLHPGAAPPGGSAAFAAAPSLQNDNDDDDNDNDDEDDEDNLPLGIPCTDPIRQGDLGPERIGVTRGSIGRASR